MSRHPCRIAARFGVILLALTGGCGKSSQTSPSSAPVGTGPHAVVNSKPDEPKSGNPVKLTLTSTAFKHGEPIPKKYSGEGDDISPPLAWEGVPAGTQEFALICDDPDARSKNPWVHWVIYGLGPDVRALPENLQPGVGELNEPLAARQGENFFDEGHIYGWRGPMPPVGRGTHHYHFKLYALDKRLDLPPKATKPQLLEAMEGHVLAESLLIGTYERK